MQTLYRVSWDGGAAEAKKITPPVSALMSICLSVCVTALLSLSWALSFEERAGVPSEYDLYAVE